MNQLPPKPRPYWFPAKRYGWGWGAPACWQGWLILMAWLGLLTGAATQLLPAHPISFLLFALAMVGLLTLICYLTGEPPGWRWGD